MQYGTRKGSMIVMTLVFTAVFAALVTSLAGFVLTQKKAHVAKENREKAVQIAEAGLDFYKWYLAHYPNDLNGPTNTLPYVANYDDPEGPAFGAYSITTSGTSTCGVVSAIDITSTGYTNEKPDFKRTLTARYARPSVAEYAFILNSNVWVGEDKDVIGPYHSNGGIRMDGPNQSIVTSAENTWLCTGSFGCSGSQTRPGIFGASPGSALWEFPIPNIDFAGISVDLTAMKTRAQASGLYFATISGRNPRYGYHMILKPNRTVDVYRVTNSEQIWSDTVEDDWTQRYERITAQTLLGNYAIPPNCGLIFAEDRIWLEGTTTGKVTVAAAHVSSGTYAPDILITGNLAYASSTGHGLTAIAENNINIPLVVPNDLSMRGIFIAQGGQFGRNNYTEDGDEDVPSTYDSYVKRNSLTLYGTIVSNGREGTKWVSGNTFISGFNDRYNSYDRDLALDPPPLTPYTSDDYTFIEWHEQN